MELHNFLNEYPIFSQDVYDILGKTEILVDGKVSNENILNDPDKSSYDIFKKKEFNELKLEKIEKLSIERDFLNHQKIIARFMSPYTTNSGILLFHGLGSGKSCTSIATTELIKNVPSSPFKHCLFLAKGKNLIQNFINELVYKCTDDIYTAKKDEYETELEKTRKINKNIGSFYSFETFEKMAKNNISPFDDKILEEKYSNYVIIIDEVHNLRLTSDTSIYSSFHRFLHSVKNCKIILLSGTPMRDRPEEIATIMNLLLPIDSQLPVGEDFVKKFLECNNERECIPVLKQDKSSELKKYFHGRISYLQTMKSDVKVKYMGSYKINYLTLYSLTMDQFQYKYYLKAFETDKELINNKRTGVYNDSRQASSFVFPDGTYGSIGFKKYINTPKKTSSKLFKYMNKSYTLKPEFLNEFKKYETEESRLKKLREYSAKYADCIEKIVKNKENHFVYMEFVEGSGAILFAKILEKLFGFSESKGQETTPGKRYAIITNKTAATNEIKNIIKLQNSSKNMNGDYLQVIIGSGIISEGFSFKNIMSIHILTPDWNFAGTEQAIFRGLRLFSHKDLESSGKDITVKIYLYCLLTGKNLESIDQLMLKTSEDKDISIKSIERAMKEASFDCPLNRNRNITDSYENGTRECDYENCEYSCDYIDNKEYKNVSIDYSTYNLFYSQKKIANIIEQIKNLLAEFSKIKIENLYSITNDKFIILKAIYIMETSPYVINDIFGYNCFVKHDNDYVYLTYDIGKSNFFDNYYVENFPLQEYGDFRLLSSELEDEKSCNMIEKIKTLSSEDKKLELFNKFSPEAQEIMIEIVLNEIDRDPSLKDKDSLFKIILQNFKEYIIDSNNVSTLLNKSHNKFRCRKNNIWVDCDEKDNKRILKLLVEKKKKLEDVKYYGINETSTGLFYIRDISEEEKKSGKEGKHKVSSGKECSKGWNKDGLLKIIDLLEISYRVPNMKYSSLNLSDMSKSQLIDLLNKDEEKNKPEYSDIMKAFSIEELNKKSKEQLIRIIEFGKLQTKKDVICSAIKEYFKNNNLIDTVITKEKKKDK